MNHYPDIMQDLDGSDIQTDEETLLFSETESEEEITEKNDQPPRGTKWWLWNFFADAGEHRVEWISLDNWTAGQLNARINQTMTDN